MPQAVRRFYLIAAVVFAWFSLALQFYLSVQASTSVGLNETQAVIRFLSFFTVTTNTVVAVLLTLALLRFPAQSPRPPAISAGTAYIIVVGVTYFFLLRKTWNPQGAQLFADIALHYVMPIATVIYWFAFVPKGELRWRDMGWWLIYPIAYLAFTLVQGPRVGWYPYPFIDVNAHGYAQIAINSVALFVFFAVVSATLIGIDRMMARPAAPQAV